MAENEEDRLSSLPDDILIDILSRIPTNFAASTSVLSHRWRNLWSGATRFNLYPPASDDFTAIVDHILGQLTSPKLTEFELKLSSPPTEFPEHDVVESCFRRVYDRFVEKVLIEFLRNSCDEFYMDYDKLYRVPFCLLNSQSLVVLELVGELKRDLELPGNGDVIHLPKLKKLKLDFLVDVPIWLGTLIRFCPLLEDLHLLFKLDHFESKVADCVDILGLNLKSLKVDVLSSHTTKHTKVSIDAPKLETLEIIDCYSSYYFVHMDYDKLYRVPFCLLNSQSLVVLELVGELKGDLELPGNGDVIHLPKLKKLKLDFLVDVPIWLGTLIRFCLLLEDLHLLFKLDHFESKVADCVDILGLNLKSLKVDVLSSDTTKHTKVSIDAPKLETLEIIDCYSSYYFVHDPSALVNACIDLRRVDERVAVDNDFVGRRLFVAGMSCASNLNLKLDRHSYILPFSDGFFPVFGNLIRLEITLPDISLNGWSDWLLSLQVCPNLKHLTVESMGAPRTTTSYPPNFVPGCFLSTLKTIQIRGLDGLGDQLKLLRYILRSASHLEQLHVHRPYRYRRYHNERLRAYAQWKERHFCESLFKFPRKSSTCDL